MKLNGVLDLINTPVHTRKQLGAFDSLRPWGAYRTHVLFVDMREITQIDPCALLHLVAQARRQTDLGVTVRGNYPVEVRALRALMDAGFEDFMKTPRFLPKRRDEHHLEIRTHHATRPFEPDDWKHLREFLAVHGQLSAQERDIVYNAFGECIENVRQHAFGQHRRGHWYALAIRPLEDQPARAVVLDLGVGIAGSVRRNPSDQVRATLAAWLADLLNEGWLADTVEKFFKLTPTPEELAAKLKIDDYFCALMATMGLRTETAEKRRGTGLSGLRASALSSPDILLHVLSGTACVTWQQGFEPTPAVLPPLRGTIVCVDFVKPPPPTAQEANDG